MNAFYSNYKPNHLDLFATEGQQIELYLENIFSNLYYTWDKDLYQFIDKLDSYNWRKTKSPSVIIHSYIEEQRHNTELIKSQIEICTRSIQKYFNEITWYEEKSQFDPALKRYQNKPILYFSAEYGLVDWLQIYSGGLGVLAGDYIKQVSDYGIPLIGVGIFYHEGYFHQDIDMNGMQNEHYIPQDPAASMLKLVREEKGEPLIIEIEIIDHKVYARAWELKVGRNSIYLLDTNFEKNQNWEDRMITAHLYGGDEDTRIRQEILLGIGGYRLIKKMGINPSVVHLNEGHASFAVFEKMIENKNSESVADKFKRASSNVLFTNHTLNAAGNDKFDRKLFQKYMNTYAQQLNADVNDLFELGTDKIYSNINFSMTILGFKGSRTSNAVSILHGKAARKLWPDYHLESITNGVHMPTWVSKPIQKLLEKYVDQDWKSPSSNTDWNKIKDIPNQELWNIHLQLKASMLEKVNGTLGTKLDPAKLTIVWTRRFAAYKRPDMFFNDIDKLREILGDGNMPVQFLIGGKAHPRDLLGKQLLQKVMSVIMQPEFKDKIVYLTGYNWNLARYLVGGADVWLNNPIKFEEASGTSGMKAGANGVLQFTTLDGWTDEVDWSDKGWVLPQENIDDEIYRLLKEEIVPTYFSSGNCPSKWAEKMKSTMQICHSQYNMGRMLEEYLKLYSNLE